jgi:hypothetical protein
MVFFSGTSTKVSAGLNAKGFTELLAKMVNGLATWPPENTKKPEKSQGGQGGQPLSFVGPPPVRPMRLAGGQTRPRRANNEEGPWPRDPWQSGFLDS